jgi:SAM-dependent methyltransferase
MRNFIKRIPVLRDIARAAYWALERMLGFFRSSEDYWTTRYRKGGNSGSGSYGQLAGFKAQILNDFVAAEGILTVLEFGCGDGNQLRIAQYPHYTGYDISPDALGLCRQFFGNDATKSFRLVGDYADEQAELSLSLDVIYHLVEDKVYHAYMERLFDSAQRFVIVYSSDTNVQQPLQGRHVRHRIFSEWVQQQRPQWHLLRRIPTLQRYNASTGAGSDADFFIYGKR